MPKDSDPPRRSSGRQDSSEERLVAERLQASAILESLAEGVMGVNAAGAIVSLNPAARALLGLGDIDLATTPRLFQTVRQGELHELVRQVLREGQEAVLEFAVFSPRQRMLRARAVPCEAPGARSARVVLVLQDVTEHHRYDHLRREFVANVSHELKSPLTSIRSLTETLLDGALEDEGSNRRFVALIEEDATRLGRLIEDLLTLSQVESRAVPMHPERLKLRDLVASVLAPREILMREKGLWVELDVAEELELRADPDRLRQVYDNLIDNAVKYSPVGGRLEIGAETQERDLRLWVRDEGPGIPPDAVTRVFERFYRVDKMRSRELGGTGLGLSIVKHIVDSHGGKVWVESPPGQGACFCFTLPGDAAKEECLVPAEPPPAALPEDLTDGLRQLQEYLVHMAGLVEEAVGRSIEALLLRDATMARRVLFAERAIDQAELLIDDLCLGLLAEHRPEGADLRLIAMGFKINADLERMGDLAANIAESTLHLLRQPLLHPQVDIPSMAELVQEMVKDSLDALIQRDVERAATVRARDDEVDRRNRRVFRAMLDFMSSDPRSVDRAVAQLLVARSLERIADHATNIAENVIYLASGVSVKHTRR